MSEPAFANPLLETVARPPPRRVAVIGAGTIGPDIGYYLKSALPQIRLTLVDVNQTAIDKALQRCNDYAKKAVAKGKMSEQQAAAGVANIAGTTDYARLADCDWVIEAATARSEKSMAQRLASELLEASENRGAAVRKREDTHRMADANKAFAHYRW